MENRWIKNYLKNIYQNSLPDGGFSERPGNPYRPDSTAWAALALSALGTDEDLLQTSLSKLAYSQMPDGRICISPDHTDVIWPTPLAILAWLGSDYYHIQLEKAIGFIFKPTRQAVNTASQPHKASDNSGNGWPWVAETYDWVYPTAMSLLALRHTGSDGHVRARQAIKFLLERQLPHGGWNYGNTVVYGQELRPQPETTGIALAALAHCVPKGEVMMSLRYLKSCVHRIRTPLSLGWSLLALSAWGERPSDAHTLAQESFNRQKVYGSYSTSATSILILSLLKENGIIPSFSQKEPL